MSDDPDLYADTAYAARGEALAERLSRYAAATQEPTSQRWWPVAALWLLFVGAPVAVIIATRF